MTKLKTTSKIALTIGFLAIPNISYGQSVEELTAQAAADNAQAARINAQVAILNAENELRTSRLTQAFGATALEGNEGSIELGDNALNHVAQAYVYKSLDKAAADISTDICSVEVKDKNNADLPKRLIFGDPVSYIRIKRQMARVNNEIDDLESRAQELKSYIDRLNTTSLQSETQVISRPIVNFTGTESAAVVSTVLTALPLIAGQFDNFSSLLRTDTTINAASITLDDAALIRAIRQTVLLNTCATLVNPEYANPAQDIETKIKLENLTTLRNSLVQAWLEKEGQLIANTPLSTVTIAPTRAQFEARRAAVNNQVNAITTAYSTLYTGLYAAGSNGLSTIDTFYAAKEVKETDLFLELRTQQASAFAIETKKPLKGTRIRFGGLVTISYELKDGSGKYKRINSVEKRTCSEVKKSSDNFIPANIDSQGCGSTAN